MGSVLIKDVILTMWIRNILDHPPSGRFLMEILLEEHMSVIYQIVCIFHGKSIGKVEKLQKFQNFKIKKFKKLKKFQNFLKLKTNKNKELE